MLTRNEAREILKKQLPVCYLIEDAFDILMEISEEFGLPENLAFDLWEELS